MSGMMEHRGYYGTVEFSENDNVLYGKVVGISGLISYEGLSIQDLRKDFQRAVDDYLTMCAEKGIEPEKEYRGKFNVRISPELHKTLAIYAATHGKTLNSTVEEAIRQHLS